MSSLYPPVGFHFAVDVAGFEERQETRFSDVSGLSAELSSEEIVEGGQNRFVQKYPVGTKYPELTLKRGLLTDSKMVAWIASCIEDLEIEPRDITVKLLNEEHTPLMSWYLVKAYPVKWSVSDLSASNNSIVVESLQFFYQYFNIRQS